jgi:hypothetical protein
LIAAFGFGFLPFARFAFCSRAERRFSFCKRLSVLVGIHRVVSSSASKYYASAPNEVLKRLLQHQQIVQNEAF